MIRVLYRRIVPEPLRGALKPIQLSLSRAFTPNPDRFLRSCKSVLHIGANSGQERKAYAKRGLRVLWIEAIPDVYAELVENIAAYPEQRALQALLTDEDGSRVKFNISNNESVSSSILDLNMHKDLWPSVHYVRQVELVTSRLDTLLAKANLGADAEFDAMVLDTQGSELMVLKGAEKAIKHVRFIKTEAADFEIYKNCATVETLTEFLMARGFRLKRKYPFAKRDGVGTCFDLVFQRVG